MVEPIMFVGIGFLIASLLVVFWGYQGAFVALSSRPLAVETGMTMIDMVEFQELGIKGTIEKACRVVGDWPTYISFDIDVLDPAYAPGTGTPEIAGLTSREVLRLLRGLRGLNLVGADVVEVSPPFDPSGGTALAAANIAFEILCLLAEAISNRKK